SGAVARPNGSEAARGRGDAQRAVVEGPAVSRARGIIAAVHFVRSGVQSGVDDHGGGAEEVVTRVPRATLYSALRDAMPRGLRRYVQHFEASIEDAVTSFAASTKPGARVLDAGAGEGQYSSHFSAQRYCALDLGIGDTQWDYSRLDVVGDLSRMPFSDAAFDACLNIVTLEHVKDPAAVVREMGRVLRPGGRLLLIAPLEWEEHQQPHDYFRYTR